MKQALLLIISISVIVGVLVTAGCGGTTTVTQTQTATQTQVTTQTVSGLVQTVTTTTGAGKTVTVTPPAPNVTVTTTVSLPANTVTQTVTATTATGPKQTLKMRIVCGHAYGAAVWVTASQDFLVPELKKRIEARTNYRLEIEELYGGTLAKLGEELETVQSGLADLAVYTNVFEPDKNMLHLFSSWIPFTPRDIYMANDATLKVWEQFPILSTIMEKDYNQKIIGWSTTTSYEVVANKPVKVMEDFKGLRLAHGGPMIPWIDAVGATGVRTTLNEAYTSLQTGVYDGLFMFAASILGYKLHEPAPYITIAGLGCASYPMVTMNLDTFNKLPKDVQNIFLEVAKEYNKVQDDMEMAKDDLAWAEFKKAGVTIYELPAAERARWAKTMDDARLADKAAKTADAKGWPGSDIARAFIKTLQDMGYAWPAVPVIT